MEITREIRKDCDVRTFGTDTIAIFTIKHDFGIPNLALFVREQDLCIMLKKHFPTIDPCSVEWLGDSVIEFKIIDKELTFTNSSIRETITNANLSFEIPSSFKVGSVDYRRNDVVVENYEEHFIVKLTFSFVREYNWNGTIPDDFMEKRCKTANVEDVISEIYCDDIFNPKWIGPTTIQFEVARNSDLGIYSEDIVYDWFKYHSLEDSVYEGTDNFWTVTNLDV